MALGGFSELLLKVKNTDSIQASHQYFHQKSALQVLNASDYKITLQQIATYQLLNKISLRHFLLHYYIADS